MEATETRGSHTIAAPHHRPHMNPIAMVHALSSGLSPRVPSACRSPVVRPALGRPSCGYVVSEGSLASEAQS